MSEAKRAKQGARCTPATVLSHHCKAAARRALEAAARASARLQALSESDEITTLTEQLDELDSEPHRDHYDKYTIIKNRCLRLQEQCNQAAAKQQNKELTFVCAVCLEDIPIDALRIATPCGHGFCEDCSDYLQAAGAASDPAPTCFSCRAPVAAVVQPFF